MLEILGKLGASLKGFWWALDEEERQQLLLAACWLAAVCCQALAQRYRDGRQRDEPQPIVLIVPLEEAAERE